MKKLSRPKLACAAAVLGVVALAAGATTPSQAAPAVPASASAATDACELVSGAITSTGAVRVQGHVAVAPPGVSTDRVESDKLFAGKNVRLTSSMKYDGDYEDGSSRYGYMVFGSDMYMVKYLTDLEGNVEGELATAKVGGGWGNYIAFESSELHLNGAHQRTTQYGLRSDGVLTRWTIDGGGVWRNTGAVKGYAAVKSLALISQTKTYDTFLANTRGGRLYTIHIPTSVPLKPVVKIVRTSTWQGFESLQAARCGKTGVTLLGIDKDTKAGYLYVVGHANGTKTVIKGLGKVRPTFNDPVTFNWAIPTLNDIPPYGE